MIIENPSSEQIKYSKGIIYLILNLINNKIYVGLSTRSFGQRYHAVHTWFKHIDNVPLQRAISKYGINNFKLFFLETDIQTDEELFKLESYYAQLFNSYIPNGYNIRQCGGSKTPPSQTCIDKCSKTYKLKLIVSNTIITILNLQKFCRENNLNIRSMRAVVSKEIRKYFNFTHPDQNLNDLNYYDSHGKEYIIQFECESPIHIKNLSRFCDKNNLNYSCMERLIASNGIRYKVHRGWHLPHTNLNLFDKRRDYIFLSPLKQRILVHGLEEFCKLNNLSSNKMSCVWVGKRTHHKGWTKSNF